MEKCQTGSNDDSQGLVPVSQALIQSEKLEGSGSSSRWGCEGLQWFDPNTWFHQLPCRSRWPDQTPPRRHCEEPHYLPVKSVPFHLKRSWELTIRCHNKMKPILGRVIWVMRWEMHSLRLQGNEELISSTWKMNVPILRSDVEWAINPLQWREGESEGTTRARDTASASRQWELILLPLLVS